jgi:predicted permease
MKRAWWRFGAREDELSAELEAHLAMAVNERVARGEGREEATAAARRQFGNREMVRGTAREMWGWVWLEQLLLDVRYALRKLRLAPGFTAVAALSLAIGIGATVTMYAVVDAADIRGLPYPQADRLYVIEGTGTVRTSRNGPDLTIGRPVLAATTADWRRTTHAFSTMVRVGYGTLFWARDDETENLAVATIGPGFFELLGATPVIGRGIAASDTNPDAPGVLVLSHSFWRDRFHADRGVIGKSLQFATSDDVSAPRQSYTIIGVMSEPIDYPAATEGWIAERSGTHAYANTLARLADGRSITAAIAELSAIARPAEPSNPAGEIGVRATSLRKSLRATGSKESFSIESAKGRAVRLAVVAFVLLIAMFNVGNLLLARSAARDHEMRIRAALGASRARLAQQLLIEGGCVAAIDGVLGVALARWGIAVVDSIGMVSQMGIVATLDWRVLAFALALTAIVGLGTGFIPVVSLIRARGTSEGSESSRASASRVRSRVQGVLLVGQIGAALTLLTGAGLLAKELLRLEHEGFGFDPTNIAWFPHIYAHPGSIGTLRGAQFRDEVLSTLAREPGVSSVSAFEMFGDDGCYPVGEPEKAEHRMLLHLNAAVNPGFLKNLRIPIVRGRDFTDADYSASSAVAILSTAAVERFWPGEDPIGKQVVLPPAIFGASKGSKPEARTLTVVGVVGNPRFGAVLGPPPLTLLRPNSGVPGIAQYLVRTTTDPEKAMPALRRAIMALQGGPLVRGTYGTAQGMGLDRQLAEQKLTTRALIAFAAVALLLAALGIHGLVAFSVAQRTREIGIRMALGAEANSVLLLVTERGVRLAAAGIAIGLAGSFGITQLLRAMLYGTSPTDPVVFFGAAALLATVVLVASYLPARHATRVDPMVALRVD